VVLVVVVRLDSLVSVPVVTKLLTEWPGFSFRQGQDNYDPHLPSFQRILASLFLEREADTRLVSVPRLRIH
jgi:hypothetical protein